MTTPTSTSTSTGSLSRTTPSLNCLYPYDSSIYQGICVEAYATSWSGCPPGYTSACGRTLDGSSDFYITAVPSSAGLSNPTKNVTLMTNFYQMVCCPDLMPWVCAGAVMAATSCTFIASADTIFDMGTALSVYSVVSGQRLSGYGVTATQAVITSRGAWEEDLDNSSEHTAELKTIVEVETTTVWCDLPSCSGLTSRQFTGGSKMTETSTSTNMPTNTPTVLPSPFVLQPPQHMGKLGNLGVFAISGLLGAIIFAAALLLPSAMEYRKRKRQQVQGQ
ncbi:uncharacterized protein ColSpa_10768 [Colletotrichum spaethianum]|uniref:Uncharacterized protein n=1 Tax=Colletotrichum spaethianum TaxID=700344 RepID=A0AA37PE85_9PEZI|nr:uncharacterized protein ColSpa_10768 [Colletotrichum spaethianum]GKT50587.1 hypothetical protein ColSpa_10768 [Colletotrichum spaethianum]